MSFIAAEWTFLVDFVPPILIVATFLPWAWLVSTVLDKDALYYHLNRRMWNLAHLIAGVVALAAMLAFPIFWIGWPVGMLLLAAPVLVYWYYRNQQVPEAERFRLSTEGVSRRLEQRRAATAARRAELTFIDAGGQTRPIPPKDDPAFLVHVGVEDLLQPAIDARANRVEIAPAGNGYQVAQTIDGVRYRREPVTPEQANRAIDFVKGVCGLDVENRRRRQRGTCLVRRGQESVELHVTTAGSSSGQEMRVEFDRTKRLDRPFDEIGLLPAQIEAIKRFEDREEMHGVVLLGAPAGHGLTTMGYAFIRRHDAFTTNVKILERETALLLDGVDHVEFDADNPDLDYATNLQSILRRDPDMVLISDIVEGNTAKIAAAPGMEGPLLYVLQRANSVQEQIVDWVRRVEDLNKAVRSLRAVVNGRLVRSLCPNCRQPYRPNPDQLKRLGIRPDQAQQFYKASGKVQIKSKIEACPVCQGTGYLGQTGIFEVMVLDGQARKMLAANDLPGAYTHCRSKGMIFMQEAGIRKVIDGVTTLEEVARVTAPPKKGGQTPPRPQPVTA